MLSTIIGAIIALVAAAFGAFISHFWEERSQRKKLLGALALELGLNRDILLELLKEPRAAHRFSFDSYILARNNGAFDALPKELYEKVASLYLRLRQLDDLSFAMSLGLRQLDIEAIDNLRIYKESLMKDIGEVLATFEKVKV